MAYTNFQHCTANEYKNIIYNQETHNKIKILFNNVELEDADEYCESFEVVSRVIPNGSKIFMLENLVSQEATLVLHNINTSIIQDQVSISIGTLVSENTYEYVPIGIYNLQEIPTTDNGKTTIKLRDNSVKLDFNYNAKPLIDLNGGTATKLQILQDICTKAGITCNVSSFIGSSDLIGIYDNTITGRQYVTYLAGSAGAIPIITRSGALDFKYLNNLSIIQIPIEIVEQYSNAENFKISRVVYEDAIRKYESGNETYDTLFLDSANPYISSQEQVASIYNIVNNFEINSFTTGRILGNPAIDSYDLIQITDYDGTIFKTFANNTLRYNGKMINTFASEISFERKKENVSLKSGAAFKKWAKTEIDNANAQITIQAGQIEEIEQDLQNPTSTKENKYFDLEDALDQPLQDFSLYGDTQQDSTTGQQLFNIFDPLTMGDIVSIDNDGWITVTYNNSSGTSTKWFDCKTKTSNLVNTGQSYKIVAEIKSVSGTGTFNLCVNQAIGQVATTQSILLGNATIGTKIYNITMKNSFDGCTTFLNSYGKFEAGQSGSITLRISVVANTSITPETFKYEPYTGGIPAPNPTYPFDIHNVSGDNTIEICGKNLCDGIFESGNINDSGAETTSSTTYRSTNYLAVKGGETLICSYTATTGTNLNICACYDKNKTFITRLTNLKTDPFTLPNNTAFVRLGFYKSGSITENDFSNVMLVYGNEAYSYEPYQGNSQLISLGVKNLLTLTDGTFTDDNDLTVTIANGKVTLNGSTNANYLWLNLTNKDYRYGTPNASNKPLWFSSTLIEKGQYSISSSNSNITSLIRVMFTDASAVSSTNLPNTTTKDIANVCIYIASSGTTFDNETFDLQITKGNKPQYVSASPIELNKISTYQDYIYKENDRWFLHKEIGKYTFTGNETPNSITNGYFYYTSSLSNISYIIGGYNTKFKFINDDRITDNGTANTYLSDNQMAFRLGTGKDRLYIKTQLSSSDLKSTLANEPLYYVLSTPTDTEITDTTLLEQLNNLMTLPLYKNMTHITLTPNDLQPIMKIEYYRDTSINENFVPKENMTKYYTKVETDAQIQINSSSIQQSVSELSSTVNGNTGAITRISNQVQNIQTSTSQQINIINEQLENGVQKVKTRTGFTFDDNGLSITKGEQFKNLNTDRNVQIISNGKEISFMGYDDNLKKTVARIDELESERATIGTHRTEVIIRNGKKRTAGFYIGGGN